MSIKLIVPDIGDFESVEIVEVLIKQGDKINKNDSIVTLESDKSSVEVPSTEAGIVEKVNVNVGDKVSKGDLLVTLKATEETEGHTRTSDKLQQMAQEFNKLEDVEAKDQETAASLHNESKPDAIETRQAKQEGRKHIRD